MIFCSLLIFVFLVIFIIARGQKDDLKIEFVDHLEVAPETLKICAKRKDGKLVLVDVDKSSDENVYLYVLKLYDHYRNSLPLNYSSPLKGNIEIIELQKKDEELNACIRINYLQSEVSEFLSALMWSYQSLGIQKLQIKINNEQFTLTSNPEVNRVVESSSIYDNYSQIILFYEENEIIPITFYHQENPIDFLIKKIIQRYDIKYQYEIIEGVLIVRIDDDGYNLDRSIYWLIGRNLELLNKYQEIIIIVNDQLVYST